MKTDDYYTDEVTGCWADGTCMKCGADLNKNIKTLLSNSPKAKFTVCPECEVQIDLYHEKVVTHPTTGDKHTI